MATFTAFRSLKLLTVNVLRENDLPRVIHLKRD